MAGIGYSFQPGAEQSTDPRLRPGGGLGGNYNPGQAVVRLLSLRLPQNRSVPRGFTSPELMGAGSAGVGTGIASNPTVPTMASPNMLTQVLMALAGINGPAGPVPQLPLAGGASSAPASYQAPPSQSQASQASYTSPSSYAPPAASSQGPGSFAPPAPPYVPAPPPYAPPGPLNVFGAVSGVTDPRARKDFERPDTSNRTTSGYGSGSIQGGGFRPPIIWGQNGVGGGSTLPDEQFIRSRFGNLSD